MKGIRLVLMETLMHQKKQFLILIFVKKGQNFVQVCFIIAIMVN